MNDPSPENKSQPPRGPLAMILRDLAERVGEAMDQIELDKSDTIAPFVHMIRHYLFSIGRELFVSYSMDDIRAVHTMLWPSRLSKIGTRQEPLSLLKLQNFNENEKKILAAISELYAQGPKHPEFGRHLLLARLFLVPFRAPFITAWDEIPIEYLKSFIEFQAEPAPLLYPGDGDACARHMELALKTLWEFVDSPQTPQEKRAIALQCFNKFNIGNLLMTAANPLPVMELRFKLMRLICIEMLKSNPDWQPPPRNRGKIRLGILSKTMLAGGETWAMLASISGLDREKYEIVLFCYSLNAGYYHDVAYYRALLDKVDDIILLPEKNYTEMVSIIRRHDLDILWHQSHFGLLECSEHGIVFIHRLARIQCATFAMHASTTGNPNFQYFINIEPSFPPAQWGKEFCEKELRVPGIHMYIPGHWLQKANRFVERKDLGIPEDAVVYFGGAACGKYNAEFLRAWLKIIKGVPNGYLVVYPFNPAWGTSDWLNFAYLLRLKHALEELEADADRVKIVASVNGEAIAHMHKWGDIYLSSFPYGGVTSLTDALRNGLCPVAWSGRYSRENGDANILTSYGLKDLLARTPEEFVEKGVRLGLEAAWRAAVKTRVKEAWNTKRPAFWDHVAQAHAGLINQIVQEQFPDVLERVA